MSKRFTRLGDGINQGIHCHDLIFRRRQVGMGGDVWSCRPAPGLRLWESSVLLRFCDRKIAPSRRVTRRKHFASQFPFRTDALGAENLVFGKDKSDEARFILGGTIRHLECAGGLLLGANSRLSASADCRIAIEWELLDRRSDSVVYKVKTRAVERKIRQNTKVKGMKSLFLKATRSLLSRQHFDSIKPNTPRMRRTCKKTKQATHPTIPQQLTGHLRDIT